jgi:hypothetical protein
MAAEIGRDWPAILPDALAAAKRRSAHGGGIVGGTVFGSTDASGREVAEQEVSIPTFNATIAHALGLPPDHITYSPERRPFTVANRARPLLGLFA